MATKKPKTFTKITIKNLILTLVVLLLTFSTTFLLNEFHEKSDNKSVFDVIDENFGEKPLELISPASVHFIDVGQGDSALIISHNKTILIDAGEATHGEIVCEYLEKYKIKKIDLLIATHPHSDHIGGMSKIVNRFDIEKIIMPKIPDAIVPTSQVYSNLLNSIKAKNLKITPAKVGNKYEFGAGVIEIMAPLKDYDDLNNNSVVIKFTYGKKSFLFTGDIEKAVEKDMLDEYNYLKADVLKIPHHGSNTSSTQEFLNAVNPKYVVISLASNNRYGFPSEKVIERIKKLQPKIFKTNKDGVIVFQIVDGLFKINATGIVL